MKNKILEIALLMKKKARFKEISRFNEKKGQKCLMRHTEYFTVFKVAKERKNKNMLSEMCYKRYC